MEDFGIEGVQVEEIYDLDTVTEMCRYADCGQNTEVDLIVKLIYDGDGSQTILFHSDLVLYKRYNDPVYIST